MSAITAVPTIPSAYDIWSSTEVAAGVKAWARIAFRDPQNAEDVLQDGYVVFARYHQTHPRHLLLPKHQIRSIINACKDGSPAFFPKKNKKQKLAAQKRTDKKALDRAASGLDPLDPSEVTDSEKLEFCDFEMHANTVVAPVEFGSQTDQLEKLVHVFRYLNGLDDSRIAAAAHLVMDGDGMKPAAAAKRVGITKERLEKAFGIARLAMVAEGYVGGCYA
jgi:hypothetical protein